MSQETGLPLSQETCRQLLSLIEGPLGNVLKDNLEIPFMNDPACNALVDDDYSNNGVNYNENIIPEESQPQDDSKLMDWCPTSNMANHQNISHRPISSLPACENWPGDFCFNISFTSEKATKGASWIYSKERNKLYVGKDVPCPVNFKTSTIMPADVFIRAMPLFSSSDHASERVTRCINHSVDEIRKNIIEAEHLVRCQSKNAFYETDSVTGRHSVLVPYENPPVGQTYSAYLYKFLCFSSCAGGPNRRALMVVFTLERRIGESSEVIGRQKIDLKVCACPVRDYNAEEKPKENKPVKQPNKGELPVILHSPTKKVKVEHEYNIKVHDKKCYQFLKKMKKIYTLYSAVRSNYPFLEQFYASSQSSNGEETDG